MRVRSLLAWSILRILALLAVVSTVRAPEVSAQVTTDLLGQYQAKVFTGPKGNSIPYRMLSPANVEPGKSYPLVLFLHGAGERGTDNKAQLVHAAAEFASAERVNQYPAYVIFPQCPSEQRWVESAWDLPSGRGEFETTPSKPMKASLQLVDSLARSLPIDPQRLYVAGLSMGGQGTWFAAASEPHRFAAMLEVCGGGDPTWAEQYDGIPVWAFHGQNDGVVPISRAREMIVALAQAGHAPEVRYTEYPEVGHNSWTQTFKRDDVFEWLFGQRKR